tara:strand:- start:5671 stop:6324 length:654 start_codon:yes stop_codon:yes gene_type:complete
MKSDELAPPHFPEDTPDTRFPEGRVHGANKTAEPPLQHRPHPFALSYGENGAKIAYGQFTWHMAVIDFYFNTSDDGLDDTPLERAGQDAIDGVNVKIPTIDSSTGDPMDRNMPNVYHELDGYGDVYLVWRMVFNEEPNVVTQCYVEVGTGTTIADAAGVTVDATTYNRFDGSGTSSAEEEGTYRIKLGSVTEDALVTQDISSDVHWSFFLMERELTA